jgi:hypothetical protein
LYLPPSVDVTASIWTDLANGKHTKEIEALVEQCVLLAIPERYGNPNASAGAGQKSDLD